jgi:hypothetical protein
VLFSGTSSEKLKMFWKQRLEDYLVCNVKGHIYNREKFLQQYGETCGGTEIVMDDKEKNDKIFHNYIWISLPSALDGTRIVADNEIILKNLI